SQGCFPSAFERLIYFASKLHPASGKYIHEGLAKLSDNEEVHRKFKEAHERTFHDWLSLNLEQKNADLRLYLSSLNIEKNFVIKTWAGFDPFWNLVPSTAIEAERILFISDLQVLLALVKYE